jgi:hypothetical protein
MDGGCPRFGGVEGRRTDREAMNEANRARTLPRPCVIRQRQSRCGALDGRGGTRRDWEEIAGSVNARSAIADPGKVRAKCAEQLRPRGPRHIRRNQCPEPVAFSMVASAGRHDKALKGAQVPAASNIGRWGSSRAKSQGRLGLSRN